MTTSTFAATVENVKAALAENGTVRLNGFFQRGTEGGRTFNVVDLGKQPTAGKKAA